MNIKNTIENYLAILASNEGTEADRIQKLILSLDELALSSNKLEYVFDGQNYPDPPKTSHADFRRHIGRLFPSLGFYNVALDISDSIAETSLAIGDAIDDMADIAGDLKEVLWRYDNTSEADALFHLQLLFRSHWGMHLRNLQLYLHDFYW